MIGYSNYAPIINITANDFTEDAGGLVADVTVAGRYTIADQDGDILTVTFNAASAHYTLDVVNQQVLLTQTGIDAVNAGDSLDAIDLKVSDGSLEGTASDTPVVTPTNDTPTLVNAISDQSVAEDSDFSFVVPTNTFADVDAGDVLILSATLSDGSALPGWLSFDDQTNTFSGTPLNADVGTLSVTVTATDIADTSVSDTFDLVVTNTNDTPTAPSISVAEDEDAIVAITLTGADIDVGDAIDSYSVTSLPGNGTLYSDADLTSTVAKDDALSATANALTLYFKPTANWFGSTSFTFTATDGDATSASATASISVASVNDLPAFSSATTSSVDENAVTTTVIYSSVASDVEGDEITYSLGGPDKDLLSIDATSGDVTLLASANYEAKDSYSFNVIATDSNSAAQTLAVTVSVVDLNDPSIVTGGTSGSGDEEATAVTGTLLVTDQDGLTDGSYFSVTTNPEHGSASIDEATGAWGYTPTANFNGNDSFTVTITDDAGYTKTQVIGVAIAAVNDTPTLVNAISDQSVAEDSDFSFVLPAVTFADVDAGDVLTLSATLSDGSALPGWLSFDDQANTFSGTPLNADVGTLSVKVTATDIAGTSVSDTFDLVVANTNDTPTASSISAAENEDATVAITLTGADIDVGDAIDSFTVTSLPSNGTLYSDADLTSPVAKDDVLSATANALTLYFKPTANWFGSTSFTFTATDGDATSALATASITVASVNDLPAFSSATTSSVDENAVTTTVIYTAVASDVDGDDITYSLGGTDKALLSIDATSGDVTLLASANYEAKDSYSFNVIATDSNSAAQTLAVTVSVVDLNDPSVVTGGTSGSGDEEAASVTGTLLVSDQDGLTDGSYFSVTTNPEHGSASIDEATGAWSYTPATNFNGNDSFTVTITDDAGYTKTQVIAVSIAAVNDTPTLVNAISDQSVAEDSDLSFVVPASTFADVDAGDVLTLSATLSDGSALPGWFSFDDQTNTFSGTPLNADVGTLSVKVTATDIAGTSVSDTFDLVVTNTNDTPTASSISVAEDEDATVAITLTGADIDVGDAIDSFKVTSLPGNGTLYSDADLTSTVAEDDVLSATANALTLYFKPTANWFGSTSFTFTATDGDATSALATASITVASVNDLPAFSSATTSSVDENAVTTTVIYTAVASDVDGDDITYSLGGTDKALLSIDATSGDVTLLASANYEAKDSYSFNVIATDSNSAAQTLAVTVIVVDLNDPSVVTGGTSGSGDEEAASVTGTLLVSDQDGLTDGSYFSVTTNPEHGSASIDEATGAWSYTPATNFNGNDSFTVTITDDAGYTKTQVIAVSIAAVNDTPTLVNAISDQSVAEDSDLSFVVPASTFADVDVGEVLILSATLSDGSALPGWLSFDDQANTFSGTPLNADVGTLSVKVTATDIAGTSVSDTFDLVVTNTNDTPSGTVTISGIVTQGQILKASNDLADADGLGTITYQWNRDGTAITDATNSTYILSTDDVGKKITVTAYYIDGHGTYEESLSSETAIVNKASIPLFSASDSVLTSGRIKFSDAKGSDSTLAVTEIGPTDTQILSAELDETTEGAVDISDVISQLSHIVGLSELSGLNKAAADNDANGSVDISDVISSLRQIVGLQEAPNARIVDAQGDHQFMFDDSVTELYVVAAGDADLSWTPLELV
nr:tandem-95 repeat protein [Marinobacterium sp. xm-a-152]